MVYALVVLGAVAATASADSLPPPNGRCVAIVGNSDLHGNIEAHERRVGATGLRHGGLLVQAGYIDILKRQRGDRLILLDAGDMFQGTLVSNLSKGASVVAAYNVIGLHAAVIGNHEFDYGPIRPDAADRLGVLKERMSQASFPFLAINIYDRHTHRPLELPNSRASMVHDAGGVRVGVIGVALVDTPDVTKPANITELEFPEPAPLIIAEAARLRADEGAELIVLLTHLGSKCRDLDDPKDPSTCVEESDLVELLNAMPSGAVDVAIGGHTHGYVGHYINGVAAIQAGSYGRALSWIDACVAADGGLDRATSRIHPPVYNCLDAWSDGTCRRRADATPVQPARFLGEPVRIPEGVASEIAPYLADVASMQARPIGASLVEPLERDGRVSLGQLVAESMRVWSDAHFGVQNLGGVRADLPAGDVIFGHVYEVLPFDNQVAVLTMTPAQIRRFLRQLVGRRGKSPYVAGLRVEVAEKTNDVEIFRADGSPLVDGQRYRVATNDFLVQGGEGLRALMEELRGDDKKITETDMREALIALLRARYPSPGASASAPLPRDTTGD